MASCTTSQWVSYAPQAKLTVTLDTAASDGDTAVLDWKLQYIASYAASVSASRAWTVYINGTAVDNGSYAINGKTGTLTVASGSVNIAKSTSAKSISFKVSFAFNVTWSGVYGGTKTASGSISIPAKTSYTITYNANGGSGAPSKQTKWFGTTLKLSTIKPTRTGYTFQGWGTSTTDTTVDYAAGANYTANASDTLYAIWKANTYTVKYNANGGSGAPANQTKTYGVTLKLSTTKPTRTNYNFLGWGASASATTVKYASGANYTANSGTTLYAVWELAYTKPRITGFEVTRCNADGTLNESGTSALVTFNWACDQTVSSVVIEWESSSNSGSKTETVSGTSGSVSSIIGDEALSLEHTYTIHVVVTDTSGYSYEFGTLTGTKFVVDFLRGGLGAAFNKPAELEGVLDINFESYFRGGILHPIIEPETDLNDVRTPNTYVGANISTHNYENSPLTTGTFTLEVVGMGEEGQVKQRLTYCHKTASRAWERIYYGGAWGEWVCVSDFDGQLLWEGAYYMTAGHTANLSEAVSKQRSGIVLVFSYYNDGAEDQNFNSFFVPKAVVASHPGKGHAFNMFTTLFGVACCKYLYINNTSITGNDWNNQNGTGDTGIIYNNARYVLRYVIGV